MPVTKKAKLEIESEIEIAEEVGLKIKRNDEEIIKKAKLGLTQKSRNIIIERS